MMLFGQIKNFLRLGFIGIVFFLSSCVGDNNSVPSSSNSVNPTNLIIPGQLTTEFSSNSIQEGEHFIATIRLNNAVNVKNLLVSIGSSDENILFAEENKCLILDSNENNTCTISLVAKHSGAVKIIETSDQFSSLDAEIPVVIENRVSPSDLIVLGNLSMHLSKSNIYVGDHIDLDVKLNNARNIKNLLLYIVADNNNIRLSQNYCTILDSESNNVCKISFLVTHQGGVKLSVVALNYTSLNINQDITLNSSVYFADNHGVYKNNHKLANTANSSQIMAFYNGVIYMSNGGALFYDNGKDWVQLSTSLPSNITSIAFYNDIIYVSIYNGGVYKLNGNSWELLTDFHDYVRIVINDNSIYASTWDHGVFKSSITDDHTWKQFGSSPIYLNGLATDGNTVAVTWLCSQNVYSSTDGKDWVLLDSSAMSAGSQVTAIVVYKGVLYVGTNKGEILKSENSSPLVLLDTTGLDGSTISSFAVSADKLLVGTSSGDIFSLSDGQTSWSKLSFGRGITINSLVSAF